MMTVFYMRSSGRIKVCLTGEHEFEMFGEEEADYRSIYGRVILPQDDFVIRNLLEYKVIGEKLVLERGAD